MCAVLRNQNAKVFSIGFFLTFSYFIILIIWISNLHMSRLSNSDCMGFSISGTGMNWFPMLFYFGFNTNIFLVFVECTCKIYDNSVLTGWDESDRVSLSIIIRFTALVGLESNPWYYEERTDCWRLNIKSTAPHIDDTGPCSPQQTMPDPILGRFVILLKQ